MASIVNNNGGLIQASGSNGIAVLNSYGYIGSLTNNAGGLIQATGIGGKAIEFDGNYPSVQTSQGMIVNSGTIQATGASGAAISNNYNYIGSITNNVGGSIQATEAHGNAVLNYGYIGSVANIGGVIQATGGRGTAINNYSYRGSPTTPFVIGSIANSLGGVIQATGRNGIAINNYGFSGSTGSTVSIGSITNTSGGIIQATGNSGVAINNYNYQGSSGSSVTIGSIANSGIIQATGANGTAINNYSYVGSVNTGIGSITNNAGGVIQATGSSGTGIYNYGYIGSITNNGGGVIQTTGNRGKGSYGTIYNYYGYIGSLTNNAGGIIQATGTGNSAIYNDKGYIGTRTNIVASVGNQRAPNLQGGISNSGIIQATGTNGTAIYNYGYIGSITNNTGGVIQATGANGIAISNSGSIGAIVNAGTILSTLGTAIVAGGTIANGITNAAGGLIQGGPATGSGTAIDATQALKPLSIVNAGTIVGAILQSRLGDTLTVNGGAIIGNVVGQPGSNGVANFALGTGSFTTGGNITGVDTVNLSSGTLIMAPGGGTISGARTFNIQSGGHAVLGSTLGAALTTNSGILDVGTNTGTLNGNFVQTANGSMEFTISGTTVGMLKITGTATITPGPQSVLLHFTGPANVLAPVTVFDAVGGLTVIGSTTLPVTSDSPNPYFQLPVVTDPDGILTLTFGTPTQSALTTYATSLFPVSTSPYLNSAAAAFGARLTGAPESTYNTVIGQFAGLTPAQLTAIAQQSAPRSVATAAAQLSDGLGANTALSNAMAARQLASHGSEGDPAGTGTTVWGQPFGSTAYQSTVQGFGGFTAGTYGAAFGGDRRITPDIRVGVAFAVANSNINYTGGASGNADSLTSGQVGVYGSYIRGNFFVDGDLSGGFNWVSSKQSVAFLGQQTGSYGGSQFVAHVGAGANVALPGAVLTYGASIREMHMGFGSYTMSGGQGPSARVNATDLDLVQSQIGGKIAYLMEPANGWSFKPEIHAYYLHNFNAAGITTGGIFSNGLPFAVSAPSRDADLINAGFGLTVTKGPLSISAAAQVTAGPSTSNDTFTLHVQSAF